jgi:hypothetical protein
MNETMYRKFSEKLCRKGIETEWTRLISIYMLKRCCKYDFELRDQLARGVLAKR